MNDKLVLDNINLIPFVMDKIHLNIKNQDEYEEFYQAGLIGLIQGVKTYNSSTKISTYLCACIKNEMLKIYQARSRKRYFPYKSVLSLDLEMNEDGFTLTDIISDENTNVEQEVIDKITRENVRLALEKIPNKTYMKYLKMYYGIGTKQLSAEEISKKERKSIRAIYAAIQRAIISFMYQYKKISSDAYRIDNKIKK